MERQTRLILNTKRNFKTASQNAQLDLILRYFKKQGPSDQKKVFLTKNLVSVALSKQRPTSSVNTILELENRICKQIQDLHASFWCTRVEEPQESSLAVKLP